MDRQEKCFVSFDMAVIVLRKIINTVSEKIRETDGYFKLIEIFLVYDGKKMSMCK